MAIENKKIDEHFWLSEFGYVKPEPLLLSVMSRLRRMTGQSIIITDSTRTIRQHIATYKKLESEGKLDGKTWLEAIPWGSRHLPAYEKGLRAVDFKAVKSRSYTSEILGYYSGPEILEMLKEIESEFDIHLGVGVGVEFCHVDVDRQSSAVWYYSY